MMLGKQRGMFEKVGITYKFLKKNIFKTTLSRYLPQVTQNMYATIVTKMNTQVVLCLIKNDAYLGVKKWIPKVPNTNSQGPKVIWVPKVKAWTLFVITKMKDEQELVALR